MSIALIIKTHHKNRIESIKNMKNGIDKDMAIGALVADLGNRSISAVSKVLNHCREKIKKCYLLFINGFIQKEEHRGRKLIEEKYPNLKTDIEKVIEKYKNVDPHFKTETLYISINSKTIIDEC